MMEGWVLNTFFVLWAQIATTAAHAFTSCMATIRIAMGIRLFGTALSPVHGAGD